MNAGETKRSGTIVSPSIAGGLLVMIVSQSATFAGIEPFASWNTPIAWTGFILFADGLVWRARGRSWIRSSLREFIFLALASIPLWLVFEFFNRYLNNWYYVGLPEHRGLRLFGYAWSFATIWPAIFEAADLFDLLRARRGARGPAAPEGEASAIAQAGAAGVPGRAGKAGQPRRDPGSACGHAEPGGEASASERAGGAAFAAASASLAEARGNVGERRRGAPAQVKERWAALAAGIGAVMLVWPVLWPSPYLAAPVFLGFILLLDPINLRLGGESLVQDLRLGQFWRLRNLIFSGFLCGILWEFWNYWARAKWHYTVPIMENLKIFEMPVPGYFGFPAFALECFTMYVFIRAVGARLFGFESGRFGRPIGIAVR